jgi:rhodanese-related sulfurtransferase
MTPPETTEGPMQRFRQTAKQAAAILLLSLALGAVSAAFHPRRPEWFPAPIGCLEVSWETAQGWHGALVLVDARGSGAYDKGHIPGALLLSEPGWDRGFPAVIRTWRPGDRIVVYCDRELCDASQSVAQRLRREMGIEEVYVLKGGWSAWNAAHTEDR